MLTEWNFSRDAEFLKSPVHVDNQTRHICYPQLGRLFRPECIGLIHFPVQRIIINFRVCLLQSRTLKGYKHRICRLFSWDCPTYIGYCDLHSFRTGLLWRHCHLIRVIKMPLFSLICMNRNKRFSQMLAKLKIDEANHPVADFRRAHCWLFWVVTPTDTRPVNWPVT